MPTEKCAHERLFMALLLVAFATPAWAAPHADEPFHFTIDLPEGWTVNPAEDPATFLRVSAGPPDGSLQVGVYAQQVDGDVDVGKLADISPQVFSVLGPQVEGSELKRGLAQKSAVERSYAPGPKGLHGRARYVGSGTFGYVLLVLSTTGETAAATPVLDSFESHVPLTANLAKKWSLKNILASFSGLIALVVLFAGLIGAGVLGFTMREGWELRKALVQVKDKAARSGATLKPAWKVAHRKAWRKLSLPPVGAAAFYVAVFLLLPVKVFLFSLLLVVPAGMGWLGIILTPDVD